jgi:two-component system chemotaxis sensor kinase CheA
MSDHGTSHKAIEEFLAEAEEVVEQLGSELADLADMADSGELNPDLLNSIFRGAHSLKGLAGMFGFTDVSELSHNMENLLDSLRLGKINLGQGSMKVLFRAHELLTSLVRSVESGGATRKDEIAACVARINACLVQPPVKPPAVSPLERLGLPEQVLGALTEYEEHRLLDNLNRGRKIFNVHTSFELTTFDRELAHISDILKNAGEVISTLPSMGGNIETHIDFDILFGSQCQLAEVQALLGNDDIVVTCLGSADTKPGSAAPLPPSVGGVGECRPHDALQQPSPTPLEAAETSTVPSIADDAIQSAKSVSRTVRVDIGKLDELMNIVGELVLAHSSISGIAIRMRNEGYSRMAMDVNKAAKSLERKLVDLQRGVMEIRMIPIGHLYEKMSRIIRKISREQGKKVELKFVGAETELDKLIVEDISDPMMHIIHNAIDHGIESPAKRASIGKDEKGTISISSYQKGSHVVIEVEDDGNGIDLDKVKAKALLRGMVTDVTSLSDREALDFIFMPGFSTTDNVSEVSGRGVGMDVVRNNIAAVSGIIDIETRKGQGARFIITLPITLAIIKALIISCDRKTYALPITSVMESLLLTDADIRTVERKEVIQLREQTLPLLRLETFFSMNRSSPRPGEFYVVVVGVAEKRLGLVVDDLLGQQDIVIKSLGESLKRFKGISGAADLGDRGTILVLDVGGMISETMRVGN